MTDIAYSQERNSYSLTNKILERSNYLSTLKESTSNLGTLLSQNIIDIIDLAINKYKKGQMTEEQLENMLVEIPRNNYSNYQNYEMDKASNVAKQATVIAYFDAERLNQTVFSKSSTKRI